MEHHGKHTHGDGLIAVAISTEEAGRAVAEGDVVTGFDAREFLAELRSLPGKVARSTTIYGSPPA